MSFKVDAIAFDLDGTLLDSRVLAIDCVLKAFEELKAANKGLKLPARDLVAKQIGKPSHQFCDALLPREHAELATTLCERIAYLEDEALREGKGQLFEGTRDALEALCSRGFRLLVVSNCSPSYLHAVSSTFDFEIYFDILDCAGDQYGKTKTDILRRGLEQLKSRACVVVGDRSHDLHAARRTGCHFIACNYGFGDKAELVDADASINSILELPQHVELLRR